MGMKEQHKTLSWKNKSLFLEELRCFSQFVKFQNMAEMFSQMYDCEKAGFKNVFEKILPGVLGLFMCRVIWRWVQIHTLDYRELKFN